MRHLATIQKIWKIEPIEGADRIELVHVKGWQCVAGKGQFQQNDLCVYFEIDSFLPEKPAFEFLRSNSFKHNDILGDGYFLKTKKFKGQISQGLVMPIDALPELKGITLTEKQDVTELLGVREWEMQEMATTGGTITGGLPYNVPKTDETRVQAEPALIREFHDREYYISTKMDGSSHSCSCDEEGNFNVTGHNYEYKDDDKSSFYRFVNKADLKDKMQKYRAEKGYDVLTIQGEYCGPGIQQNRLRLKGPEWYVFTVRIDGKRVGLKEMQQVCQDLDLETVPIEEIGTNLDEKYPTVEALLARADGEYPNGGKKEGIVIRTTEPVFSETILASLSMKVVSNKYLLKEDALEKKQNGMER